MTNPGSAAETPYVLGTGEDELNRLAMQHRLWADAAHAAWKLAKIGPGSRVLDIGCGPGHAAMDLAALVTPAGHVTGVDESAAFIGWMNNQCAVRGLAHARGIVGDVQSLDGLAPGAAGTFDAAYARWVLCFVPRPEDVVRSAAILLRPGGRLVVHDYFNYTSMTMAPRRVSHDRAVAATAKSWRDRGGDPDVVGRLPDILLREGFVIEHLAVHQRLGRGSSAPGERDSMFAWGQVWWQTFAPKLVAMGLLDQKDCVQLLADLEAAGRSDSDFISLPPVYEVVARKK